MVVRNYLLLQHFFGEQLRNQPHFETGVCYTENTKTRWRKINIEAKYQYL